ncbi:hypothetical protein H4Q26_000253 [Puccinia striiformis f. sp. tritici PST-130]|nr:hypothetical protein H4Q26_000253 [Puccinia striiformis f. sp. tritici PST-130]
MLLSLIAPANSTSQCFSFYLFHLAPILPWPIYDTRQFPTFPPHNRSLHPRQANSAVTLSTLMTTAITSPDYMSTPPSPTLSPSLHPQSRRLHPQSSRLNTASLPSPLSVYRGSLFQPCHLQSTHSVFSTIPALQCLPIHRFAAYLMLNFRRQKHQPPNLQIYKSSSLTQPAQPETAFSITSNNDCCCHRFSS